MPELIFDLPELYKGAIANAYVVTDDKGGVFIKAHLDNGQLIKVAPRPAANVRVVHLSPNAPAVDVWLDGQGKAVNGLDYLQGTGYAQLAPKAYDIDIAGPMAFIRFSF